MIDQGGIAQPALLLIVEEALDAGLEEVIIIVQEDDLEQFDSFFNARVSIKNYNKLPPHFQEYAQHLLEMGRRYDIGLPQYYLDTLKTFVEKGI